MRRLLITAVLAALAPASAQAYFDVAKLPQPAITGAEIISKIDEFSSAYPARVTGTPNELAAATFLNDQMNASGFPSEIVDLPIQEGAPAGSRAA